MNLQLKNFKDLTIQVLSKYCSDIIINDIFDRLNEPHRFYHNWDNHIEYMFKIAEKLGIELADDLILAIIFHDIIYDPLA
jgi:predicted metal-dependent HD superfamily phosphohydrolase